MKKRAAVILLGMLVGSMCLMGCTGNKATEAANESAETEKEGNGEDEETKKQQEPQEEEGTETTQEVELEKVGILLPRENERYKLDASTMVEQLQSAGYAPQVYYADGDVSMQVSQIQELIDGEASAMIIDPVDAYSLPAVLAKAKEQSIPVFSYENLIMDSDAVNYYTVFNSREVGQLVGNAIVDKLGLSDSETPEQPYTIEFLMGSPDDNTALFFYNGLMEVLQQYLDNQTLICTSQKTSFDDTAIMRSSASTAKEEINTLMAQYYEGETPDVICTADDAMAGGVIEALEEAGMLPGTESWPMVTGVGSEADAVKRVAEGVQAMTVFMDNRTLAEQCVNMVTAYLKGDKPEVKDYEQYDNGKKIIGTYTCEAHLIDADNYQLLIDNGYYDAEEVEPEALPSVTPSPTVTEAPEEEEKLTGTPVPEGDSSETQVTGTPAPETEITPTPKAAALTATPTPTSGAEKSVTGTPKPDSGEAKL